VIEREGIERLERAFKFENSGEALAFTNKAGQMAESEGHHPVLLTEWAR
jgi:4a-hydroxytetrahydrobiopterin dehydratase